MKRVLVKLIVICCLPVSIQASFSPRSVVLVGTGYVGLITGAGLAQIGHSVVCADIDKQKIALLNRGQMPIFEPGLEKLVADNVASKRLFFTNDVGAAIRDSDIVIVAVGTPMGKNGEADLSAFGAVAQMIADNLNSYKIICIKSTVPVGTNEWVRSLIVDQAGDAVDFDLVSNPEFLRAGCAIKDFFGRTPIVLGSDSKGAIDEMVNLYTPLVDGGADLITTNFATAELIKYAWNAFSATRITYVNEIANLCSAVGADIATIVRGVSFSCKLLPTHALRPGPGIGGSCLPKDTRAAVQMAAQHGVDLNIVRGVIESNEQQKVRVVDMLSNLLDDCLEEKKVAVLGLSFKPNTDDVRSSPAIPVIKRLFKAGALVRAYDPRAMQNMKRVIPNGVVYCASIEEVLDGADAVILLTDWQEFKQFDLDKLTQLLKNKVVVDGRNMWSPRELESRGVVFANMGRAF